MQCQRKGKSLKYPMGLLFLLLISVTLYIKGYGESTQIESRRKYPGNSLKSRGSMGTDIDQSDAKSKMPEFTDDITFDPATGPADVMIMAYMRSGSTFMGKVLGHRHDTLYWYEPLHPTHTWTFITDHGDVCGGGCTTVSDDSMKSLVKSKQFLLDLYNCQHLDEHVTARFRTLAARFSFAGPKKAAFKQCLNSSQNPCSKVMEDACLNSTHRVTKVLRLATAHASYFLENLPRLKLVQIFRDPRGIVNSLQQSWEGRLMARLEKKANVPYELCTRMEKDIDSALELYRSFPGRVKILQYESFSDPLRLGRQLYKFLNMNMTDYERKMLKSLSRGEDFNPNTFRTTANWTMIESVNKHCRTVLRKLGYRVFERLEDLRNTNVSSALGELPYAIGWDS